MCKVCTDASPGFCARFYPIWCIVNAVFFIMGFIAPLVRLVEIHVWLKPAEDAIYKHGGVLHFIYSVPIVGIALLSIYMFVAVLYIIAGVLMLVGDFQVRHFIYMDKAVLFRIGKILSYFFPIANVLLIYPLIVHAFAVLKLSEFQKERWH